jgi:thiol:disulfide interchange protein DsbG
LILGVVILKGQIGESLMVAFQKFLLGLLCWISFSFVWAKEDIRIPPQLKAAIAAGDVSLDSEFKVTDEIRGLVLKRGIDHFLVYETKDGNVIEGSIIAPSGQNLTEQHKQTILPSRDLKLAISMMEQLGGANVVTEGARKSKSSVYIFVDLNCGYCFYLWQATRDYVNKHPDVQLKWVPVAVLGEDSGVKSAHVLANGGALDIFSDYKINYRKKKGDLSGMTAKGRQLTLQNNQVLRSFGYSGTPSMLFVDENGVAGEVQGMP